MAPRKTTFNSKWNEIYPWMNAVSKDDISAYCKYCKRIFSIPGKGEGCVRENAQSAKHKESAKHRATASSHSSDRFFLSMFRFVLMWNVPIKSCLFLILIYLEPKEVPNVQNRTKSCESQIELDTSECACALSRMFAKYIQQKNRIFENPHFNLNCYPFRAVRSSKCAKPNWIHWMSSWTRWQWRIIWNYVLDSNNNKKTGKCPRFFLLSHPRKQISADALVCDTYLRHRNASAKS